MSNITINAQSSIRMEGSKIIYFDPFRITEERHDADIIFITHEHFDHFSPEDIQKVANRQTILIAPFSMEQIVQEVANITGEIKLVDAADLDGHLIIDDILVKWVRAYNIGKPFHTKERDWVGYVVTFDGTTYFVPGDTDANEDNINVNCDVLLVPCGGKYTFDALEAADFTCQIKPHKVIPTHYTNVEGQPPIEEVFKEAVLKTAPKTTIVIKL